MTISCQPGRLSGPRNNFLPARQAIRSAAQPDSCFYCRRNILTASERTINNSKLCMRICATDCCMDFLKIFIVFPCDFKS
ncbi:hypothetical protein BRYFOR_05254 [Marvinbryantia formatexigens DSM 14469]|uniref:Uncharacterized protein n=1 Tax=Marvinbryantia formatexigens DSM 14469 TaxID=478749 RepID=C6L9G4_9FIRM|nr:hypothetical protein BRYFOR_05254 [Marvinbryantia formatexigens DSM 14469]